MSEAAPGTPDSPAFSSTERARVAASTRGLIDALMSHPDTPPESLTAAADVIDRLVEQLGGRRDAGAGYSPRSHDDYLPRSPVVGTASPLSPGLEWEVIDDHVHTRGRFGAAYEGPPGFVHGGMVALAFDEVLGIVNIATGNPGMTGTLTVRYRHPTPLYAEVLFEAWVERVEGRRIISRGTLHHGDVLCAEAEGLFIEPRPELAEQYFGPRD